jgi:hypothetical protein
MGNLAASAPPPYVQHGAYRHKPQRDPDGYAEPYSAHGWNAPILFIFGIEALRRTQQPIDMLTREFWAASRPWKPTHHG